jgi:hypothetical protein
MRTGSVVVTCSALAGFWGAAALALAQQKTEKACQAEWDANKAIFQPKGITEQEYVDECRDFRAAPAAPAAAPKEAAHGAAPLGPKSAPRQAKHAAVRAAIPAAKPTQASTTKTENRRTTAPP